MDNNPIPNNNPEPPATPTEPIAPGSQNLAEPAPPAQPTPLPDQSPQSEPAQPSTKWHSVINKKQAIIGGAIVGVALVAALIFAVIIPLLSPSRQDYAIATQTTQSIQENMFQASNITTVFFNDPTYMTKTTTSNDLDSIKKNYESHNNKMAELAELRAIKGNKTARELHEKLVEKNKEFDDSANTVIELYEKIYLPLAGIETSSSANIAKIVLVYEGMGDLKFDINKKLVADGLVASRSLRDASIAYEAGPSSYDAYSAALKAYTDLFTDVDSNMRKMITASDPSEALKKLNEYLLSRSY